MYYLSLDSQSPENRASFKKKKKSTEFCFNFDFIFSLIRETMFIPADVTPFPFPMLNPPQQLQSQLFWLIMTHLVSFHSQKPASPRRPAPHQRQEVPSVFQTDDYFTSHPEPWRTGALKELLGPDLRSQSCDTVETTFTASICRGVQHCSCLNKAITAFSNNSPEVTKTFCIFRCHFRAATSTDL